MNPDVVVAGAGMAGLVAATAAQEDGAHVLLVEKGAEPGGSLALAGGYVWTMPTFEAYRKLVPYGDPDLGRLVIDDFETGVEWLRERGVHFGPRIEGFGEDAIGVGYRLEPDGVSACVMPLLRAFRAVGGELICGEGVHQLSAAESGLVVTLRTPDGRTRVQETGCLVIATGGFQGDRELVTRYITPWADHLVVRSNPHSTGDGLRLALGAGAGVSRGLSAFYGHLLPAEPTRIEPALFRVLSQFYSPHAILLNCAGRRFTDESRGDAVSALALSREAAAAGFLVFDGENHRRHVAASHLPDMPAADPVERIRAAGGEVLVADSVPMLCAQLERFGVPPAVAEATINAYDAAAAVASPQGLDVPRRQHLHRCSAAPFHAVPVRPGITFTEGGVRVDETCQVLDRDGHRLPRLFAAGVDVGGFSYEGYAGGLAAALVTGLRAGVHASRAAV